MSGAATVAIGSNHFLTGGDADAGYFFPVSYPISLAATNAYWTYWAPYYSLNIAPGAVVSDGNIVLYGGGDGTNSLLSSGEPITQAMDAGRSNGCWQAWSRPGRKSRWQQWRWAGHTLAAGSRFFYFDGPRLD